jgi:hypothetical protein
MKRSWGIPLALVVVASLLVLLAFDSDALALMLGGLVIAALVIFLTWLRARSPRPSNEGQPGDPGFPRLVPFGSRVLGCGFSLLLLLGLLTAIIIPNFIHFGGGGKHRIRDAFLITRQFDVRFSDGRDDQKRERLIIVPAQHLSMVDLSLDSSQGPSSAKVVLRDPFRAGVVGKEPRFGMEAVLQDDTPLLVERKGLLTSRIVFEPHDLVLKVVDLQEEPPGGAPRPTEEWEANRVSTETWTLNVTLPKNAFLVSFPPGKLEQHPDRDVLSVKSEDPRRPVEIYILPALRFELVRGLATATLESSLVVKLAKWLFGPALLALVMMFRETLTQTIVKGVKKVFSREKPPMGFKPGDQP